jgi:SAM-dependent methyltransferase
MEEQVIWDVKLKVDLGSGLQASEVPDYIHVDKRPGEDIDYVWDLECGLPTAYPPGSSGSDYAPPPREPVFPPNSVDEFQAHHVLEHIHNLIPLMDEMWTALKPDGRLHICVPNAEHTRAAWSDPTHVRAFTKATFDYFTPETLAAFPYTRKPWKIVKGPIINGTPPDDLWEIEVVMQPIKDSAGDET